MLARNSEIFPPPHYFDGRSAFARMVAEDAAQRRHPDPLKEAAREVFEMEPKGRSSENIDTARQYLMESVSAI